MSLAKIIGVIREFASGEEYDLDSAGGRIFIDDEGFNGLVTEFLSSPEAMGNSNLAKDLIAIRDLNERLRVDEMDDPEPVEDELLGKCWRFLKNFGGYKGKSG